MKKSVLFTLAALAAGAFSANAQEVTYVEDCSQGYLMNKAKDNWFMTVEGGTNILFGKDNIHAELKNRFGANGGLYFGKWVNPNFGFRFGGQFLMTKGATMYSDAMFRKMNEPQLENGAYPTKMMAAAPEFDVLINLTNWWCGYRPGRVYNAVLHGGGGAMFTFRRAYDNDGQTLRWRSAHSTPLFINVGLQNNFAVSKHVQLFLDIQYQLFHQGGVGDRGGVAYPHYQQDAMASIGVNVNFGKTEWNCPVTAVCPTWKYTDAEGDALVARLAQAEAKIKDLQRQLDECLKRPMPEKVSCEGLATIYYPINQYSISNREKTILKSLAEVMKETPNQKYILTGWADNYTGNDEINTRLRNQRVNTVKAFLVKCGVNESQLDARIDAANLTDFGAKGAPLDRAVTIKLAD
ncbi:MAG: OmpA family protein [Muribaculaceae bacterium]|nr:OmpA family protein [Muribaculaceae bacterium]